MLNLGPIRHGRGAAVALAAALVAACASAPTEPPLAEAAPQPVACPTGLPEGARCLGGQDSRGAQYLVAVPKDWNGHLVVHAHGGPNLEPPRRERVVADLQRWSVVVKAGFAWAGSTYVDGGMAVTAAAVDTERVRRIFVRHVAVPKLTILHGQSWGAGVAAKGAELHARAAGGRSPYDAVLLTSGVLGGGTRSYDARFDLRVVYQHLCQNHPLPSEPQYPLGIGLPAGSPLTPDQLAERAKDCLGVGLPAAQRTAEQTRRLRTLERVIGVPESSLQQHLRRATFDFSDIAQRYGGASPFGNIGARYRGSDDDDALNAAVLRYAADADAVRRFGDDSDPTGQIPVPVLTVHAINDPIAFVELENQFRQTMRSAGTADRLVQVFTEHSDHSYLSDPVYPAALQQLLAWVEQGRKPTQQTVADACAAAQATFGPGCRMVVGYEPKALDTRVAPRQRP